MHCYIDVSGFAQIGLSLDLVKLMDVFKSNGFTENFINNYLKMFLGNKHRIQEKLMTVPKKPLFC